MYHGYIIVFDQKKESNAIKKDIHENKEFTVVVTLYVIVMARSLRRSHLDGIASQSLAMTPSCTVYHYRFLNPCL